MLTRSDYMDGRCSHAEYYREIAGDIGLDLRECLILSRVRKSTDPHLNDIPLVMWDRLATFISNARTARAFRERGDFMTAAGLVCLLKQAARDAAEK